MIIKVCGMRDPENIKELVEINPDYAGFIFYPQSKRFIGEGKVEYLNALPSTIKKTGVFVNETMDVIADKVIQYNLDAVQLHGEETAEFCSSLGKSLKNLQIEKHVEIIKAFGISDSFNFALLADYEDVVDYFLFDTKTVGHGGSGRTFDWRNLKNYQGKKPYFLSGGLSSDNIHGIAEIKDAKFYGVDLNSRFEIEPGLKDINKLRSVFKEIRCR